MWLVPLVAMLLQVAMQQMLVQIINSLYPQLEYFPLMNFGKENQMKELTMQ